MRNQRRQRWFFSGILYFHFTNYEFIFFPRDRKSIKLHVTSNYISLIVYLLRLFRIFDIQVLCCLYRRLENFWSVFRYPVDWFSISEEWQGTSQTSVKKTRYRGFTMAQDYKHDEQLFTKNGKPLIFFLRPCAAKSTIRPLVEVWK